MTPLEIWIIASATLLGPVLAVQAQKWIERGRERRNAQLQVFHWLMATRATRLANEHVQSLNRIELEFRGNRQGEKAVRDAWRRYADNLHNMPPAENEAAIATWSSTSDILFVELLFQMSQALGFTFDHVQIQRGVYYPKAHSDLEQLQRGILYSAGRVLTGMQPLKVEAATTPEAAELQATLSAKMATAYGEDGALKVRILEGDDTRKKR